MKTLKVVGLLLATILLALAWRYHRLVTARCDYGVALSRCAGVARESCSCDLGGDDICFLASWQSDPCSGTRPLCEAVAGHALCVDQVVGPCAPLVDRDHCVDASTVEECRTVSIPDGGAMGVLSRHHCAQDTHCVLLPPGARPDALVDCVGGPS